MEYKLKKNKVKVLLGMEVKLAQMKLQDGITILEAEAFEPDYSVGIVQQDGIVPLPVGEYVLEDGRTLVVMVEGIIAEIKDATPEAAPAPESPDVVVNAGEAKPKRVVESVSKETFFSKEDVESVTNDLKAEFEAKLSALQVEIDALKADKEGLETKLSSIEAGASPIVPNPEPKDENSGDFNSMTPLEQYRYLKKKFNK